MLRVLLFGLMTLGLTYQVRAQAPLPSMKFSEVKEIAPGVFFRYSSISATDKSVPFGGSNNIWVVFEDYVLVFDANFPKEAGDVIEAIKKTTNKPIRYVLDSHHHGDHAYGNAVFAKAGATVISSANTARLLRVNGPAEFFKEGKAPGGRKDVAASTLKVPDLIFDEKLVFDDGKQRAELYFLGHAHTMGDAFLYLPKHKILCTGDACTNGPFNYMGHSNSLSWIRVLDRAFQFDVDIVCPGHGPLARKDLLKKQQRVFTDMHALVQKGIEANKPIEDIIAGIDWPWHLEWTGIPGKDRVEVAKHIYDEQTGRVPPLDLVADFGIFEGPSPTKEIAGWTKPTKIVVPNLMPARLMELKRIAPDVLFVPVKTLGEAAKEVADADAVLGFCSADIVQAGKKLRWIQVGHAGVENDLVSEVVRSNVTVTNTARIYGTNVADQALALLLSLTRGLALTPHADPKTPNLWERLKTEAKPQELHRKTMLVVGLGGIGTQIAQRGHGFGMNVLAIDVNDKIIPPTFVSELHGPGKLHDLLPRADVVVLAVPLTEQTRGMFAAKEFAAMKPTAYFINIARGGLMNMDALVNALQKNQIAGAGLDVTDPEPLPDGHPLWKMKNVALSPHTGGQAPEARERQWLLYRENLRRFVAGEKLLCVVDKARGY